MNKDLERLLELNQIRYCDDIHRKDYENAQIEIESLKSKLSQQLDEYPTLKEFYTKFHDKTVALIEPDELKTLKEKAEVIDELEKDNGWCDILTYVRKSKIQNGENIAKILLQEQQIKQLQEENKKLKQDVINCGNEWYDEYSNLKQENSVIQKRNEGMNSELLSLKQEIEILKGTPHELLKENYTLKEELKEITASCDLWAKESLKRGKALEKIDGKIPDIKSLIHSITKNSTKVDKMFSKRYEEELFAYFDELKKILDEVKK